jgi:predicted amidohydrolase YtcJ
MTAMLARRAAALLVVTLAAACGERPEPADLVVVGGKVYTSDSAHWTAEGFAVKGGRVVFVGSSSGAMAYKGSNTQVEDAKGATVYAGLVDAHGHVANLGLRGIDLMGTGSYEEIVTRVAERAKSVPKGEWILGRGWDQNDWTVKEFPTNEQLSAATPDHPVVLTRVDGHAILANAAALRLAKIPPAAKDPAGGQIIRGKNGAMTGVFIDNAMGPVRGVIPPPTLDQMKTAILTAQEQMHRWGLTGVHDAGEGTLAMQAFEDLGKEGKLSARFYIMLADDSTLLKTWFDRNPAVGMYDGTLWVRMIKAYMDGALGSRGALLLRPYSDDAHNTGLERTNPAHIRELADKALAHGYQLGVHAIGDSANRSVLNAFEAALKANPKPDHRFRVEHAQIIDPADIPRFKQLGVIPSMQASHQTSDMYWAGERLGEQRLVGAYAWQALIKSGVIVPNGSDFPVEKVNPLISFHSAISRQDEKNWPADGWRPDERMTRDQALLSMTMWPAFAAFEEKELGSITVGKRADFTILDRDIMTIPAEQVLSTGVVATFVGGKPVYRAQVAGNR